MRVDNVKLEGRCACGEELDMEGEPETTKLPMLVELRRQCRNPQCRRKFHIHVQEILPLPIPK